MQPLREEQMKEQSRQNLIETMPTHRLQPISALHAEPRRLEIYLP